METVFLSAEDVFQLRCSVIHSGSSEIAVSKRRSLRKAEFFDDSSASHLNKIGDFLQLKVSDFSTTLFDAADEWDTAMAGNASVQALKVNLLTIHRAGTSISSVTFR